MPCSPLENYSVSELPVPALGGWSVIGVAAERVDPGRLRITSAAEGSTFVDTGMKIFLAERMMLTASVMEPTA